MSEKINRYVKFIQNEQKRLNHSTVVSPRNLYEVQGQRGGGGAAGPEPRVGPGGTAIPSAYQAAMRRMAKKEPDKPIPSSYETALKRAEERTTKTKQAEPQEIPTPKPKETLALPAPKEVPKLPAPKETTTTASTNTPFKPRAEYKSGNVETLKTVGKVAAGVAGTAGTVAALQQGSELAKKGEEARAYPSSPPESNKPTSPQQPAPQPAAPTTSSTTGPVGPNVDTEHRYPVDEKKPEEEKKQEKKNAKIVPGTAAETWQRKEETNLIDLYANFIGNEAKKLKSSTIFSEQDVVKAQPVKAKPVSELDTELEDKPGINPMERGAKFQPTVRSSEYTDYLRQNQDKIIAAKRAREEAGPFKSTVKSTSVPTDKESI